MSGNDIVANFIRNILWTNLPADVRAKAKVCLLDALGAIIAGNPAVITGISKKYATRMWPDGDDATIEKCMDLVENFDTIHNSQF